MPTISSSVVPPPKSWDEFEDITLAAAKLRWNSTDFQRNGRSGQKQDGVDVFGHDDDDRHIGVQCKNTVDGITLATVEKEIVLAESFEPLLDRLYIATTAKRDAPLQQNVRKLSAERKKALAFRVDILFWDDICQDLAKNDDVFFAHYPQFRTRVDGARKHDMALFEELTTLLRSDGVIGFLDQTNMAGFSFASSSLDPLEEFRYSWNCPEREFLSPALDDIRRRLWETASEYLALINQETFPAHLPGRQTIPEDWEHTQPKRFWEVVNRLHSLAEDIVTLHTELVRTGKRELVANAA
jgi:hypothetical protein